MHQGLAALLIGCQFMILFVLYIDWQYIRSKFSSPIKNVDLSNYDSIEIVDGRYYRSVSIVVKYGRKKYYVEYSNIGSKETPLFKLTKRFSDSQHFNDIDEAKKTIPILVKYLHSTNAGANYVYKEKNPKKKKGLPPAPGRVPMSPQQKEIREMYNEAILRQDWEEAERLKLTLQKGLLN